MNKTFLLIPLLLAQPVLGGGRVRPSHGLAKATDEEVRARARRGEPDALRAVADRGLKDMEPVLKSFADAPAPELPPEDDAKTHAAALARVARLRIILDHERAQEAARMALAKLGDEALFQAFVSSASTGDVTSRNAAIAALGYIGDRKAVPLLARFLYEKGPYDPRHLNPPTWEAAEGALALLLPDVAAELKANNIGWKRWWEESHGKTPPR